ncbi:hypothetical protein A2Z33_00175 [Candidatus Gottesmanbacteria bacterium RBG_16_52_11]|uniref:Uncharacterized protein n=1 Tax=Candidatus Gottesmanbacteria bacterium RBG_16_52_11 TaxID=1798374 RepID=A0A1F5YPC5_9BACT|nr:MAG: hypothetical protein A2Z33_00175 [Candidatus Gottesmanbacteria bacterium RBG_16_52_11]
MNERLSPPDIVTPKIEIEHSEYYGLPLLMLLPGLNLDLTRGVIVDQEGREVVNSLKGFPAAALAVLAANPDRPVPCTLITECLYGPVAYECETATEQVLSRLRQGLRTVGLEPHLVSPRILGDGMYGWYRDPPSHPEK